MKLSPEEKRTRREAFREMRLSAKLDHIYTYYKGPILLTLAALLILGSVLRRQLTQKEPLLYVGLVNISVSSDMEDTLNPGFLAQLGRDARREEILLYPALYLSEDADTLNHEYAYASRIKTLASIQAKKLDLVLMNREAYDIFSHSGYLLPLEDWLGEDGELAALAAPYLCENELVLSDNAIEYELHEAETHEIVTERQTNALLLSACPKLAAAGFGGEVYGGVIANSPRLSMAAEYLRYLLT